MSQADLISARRSTLDAVTRRILPSDDGPGAAEAGVIDCFEAALRHPYLRGLRPTIERVLDELEAGARDRFGEPFSACAPARQDELLQEVEESPLPARRLLFRALVSFTLEGFLCDPVHGGNRDFVGWKLIGAIPDQLRSGRCLGEGDGA